MSRIAFLGLGRMGAPMAGRLLAAGHDLTVWNRTPGRADQLVAGGARLCDSPRAAVLGREIVITMLTDAAALDSVLDDAVDALPPGALMVEMSTIDPSAVNALRTRLPETVRLVDAPVSGSVPAARAGTLVILAGGTSLDVAACVVPLGPLGTIRHVGPQGAGAGLKLVVNSVLVSSFAVLGEALSLTDELGLDRDTALDLLTRISPLADRIRARPGTEPPNFTVGLADKDLGLALEAGAGDLIAIARAHTAAATADGLGDHDLTRLIDHMRSTTVDSHRL